MGMKYKTLSSDVIQSLEQPLREAHPGMDTFFQQSGAALYGVSTDYFRYLQRTDPALGFIVKLPGGQIATVAASVTAAREQRIDARRGSTPLYQFTGGFSLSDSSSGTTR